MPETDRRLLINWVSPLPPAQTAIAQYAARTLPALAQHCDVVAWTNRRYWPRDIEAHARIRSWEGEPWAELNAADATLLHIGNNIEFHGWIWEIARQHPSIIVLHDVRLHEFFASVLLDHGGGEGDYVAAVERCHGEAGRFQAERLVRGRVTATELAATLPMTELMLVRARGAVVHTHSAFEEVRGLGRCPVLELDLPLAAGPEPPDRPWDGTLRLIVFGFLGPNRRLPQLLEAIKAFPGRDRLQLDIFGQLRDSEGTASLISDLSLTERVRIHGFVRELELDQALDQAHLAINLRYPTMGEASDSQLRIWSRALGSIVTRTGWYAELPPDVVWHVDPDNEIADLHEHFNRALAAPAALSAMGRAGRRRLLELHTPERYAEQLVQAVAQMIRMPVSITEPVTAAAAGMLAGSGMSDAAKATVARRVAAELARWVRT